MGNDNEVNATIRAAAQNIKYHISDLQVFVLQPSNRAGEKNKALETTMRIDRLAGAILAASNSNDVPKPEQPIPEAA